MKFLETLKKYEKLVVEENAKLQSIYNTLINEAKDEGIAVDEVDILNNKPHNAHVSESEDDATKEDVNECGDTEDTNEADTSFAEADEDADQIPEDEFINAANESEEEEVDEADKEMMSADEFFGDSEEEEVSEADETCPECKKKPCVCEKDEEEDNVEESDLTADDFIKDSDDEANEAEKEDDTDKDKKPVDEAENDEEEKFNESLDHYRKLNARLFQD